VSSVLRWRAGEARDGLLVLAYAAHREGVEVPQVVKDLLSELHALALAEGRISEVGNVPVGVETIDDMRTWGSAEEAGQAVGLSGRRVRQLCADGYVSHRIYGGGRYLVDVGDLQAHLKGRA